jgi:hypothetical protein
METPQPETPVSTPTPKPKATKAAPKEPAVGATEKTSDGKAKTYHGEGIFSIDS